MPTPWKRDLKDTRRILETWMRTKLPGASELAVSELVEPQSSGFSNETLLFDAAWTERGQRRSEPLVIRIQPTGYQVFPEYDLGLQFRTMELLGPTDVPVPRVLWLEQEQTDLLGAPFYVMGRVEGRVPEDNPPYHAGGWLTEIEPEERRAIWLAGFDCMARIHRLDPAEAGFSFLDRPELAEEPLDQEIVYYERYLEWAARGREQPTAEAALDWIKKHKPTGEPTGLVWGDARIGNIIFDGTRPAAVLDWEMVGLGSPEQDVGWAIFLDRHHSEGIETPRLEGFPSYDETIAYYEEQSGREVKHLHFYQAFTGFRFAVIMMRLAQQMVHYELMDEATGREFERNNTVTRLLAKILELPPPGA